jgi:hypothetical protein
MIKIPYWESERESVKIKKLANAKPNNWKEEIIKLPVAFKLNLVTGNFRNVHREAWLIDFLFSEIEKFLLYMSS